MSQVFISYVEEDGDVVAEIIRGLEDAGLTAWAYQRDSLPGPSYLAQIAHAIQNSLAIIVIISPDSISSDQVTSEVVRGFELGKPFVPLLRGLGHADFQRQQPEWRGALRAATSIQIPPAGVTALLPRVVRGLQALGITRSTALPEGSKPALDAAAQAFSTARPSVEAAGTGSPGAAEEGVELTATFDQEGYPVGDDSMAYCLVEFVQKAKAGAAVGVDADLALVLDASGSMDKPNRYPLLREAVRRLVAELGPEDRVSVTVFSFGAETVVRPLTGADAVEHVSEIIACMDRSHLLFGPKTLLAPGLAFALEVLGPPERSAGRVRRVYVLTDGELHDPEACESVLATFRASRVEVHVYGFGDEFQPAALKRLVSDQLGGTVKPICNERDIVQTFVHLARVNRRLIGEGGKVTVAFSPKVVCGDAWAFRPAGRYLGTIQERRLEHVFGGLQAGRVYSLLLEVRLPPDESGIQTHVADAEVSWTSGKRTSCGLEVSTRRAPSGPAPAAVPLVRRAFDTLNALRHATDPQVVLASLKARKELAVLEKRDPQLIAALDKMIAKLSGSGEGQTADQLERALREGSDLKSDVGTVEHTIEEAAAGLTPEERLYVESDESSFMPWPE